MNIDFSKFSNKKKSNINKKSYVNNIIVERNIKVTIKQDLSTKIFYISHNDKVYEIHNDSYNSKNRKAIYSINLDKYGHRIKILRDIGSRHNVDKRFYLPFAKGLIVIGNLIKCNDDIIRFMINFNRKLITKSNDEIIETSIDYKEYLNGFY